MTMMQVGSDDPGISVHSLTRGHGKVTRGRIRKGDNREDRRAWGTQTADMVGYLCLRTEALHPSGIVQRPLLGASHVSQVFT